MSCLPIYIHSLSIEKPIELAIFMAIYLFFSYPTFKPIENILKDTNA